MKKGRHRRFEEARELKRGREFDIESILDEPGQKADTDEDEDEYEEYKPGSYVNPELD